MFLNPLNKVQARQTGVVAFVWQFGITSSHRLQGIWAWNDLTWIVQWMDLLLLLRHVEPLYISHSLHSPTQNL
jgi:hypothetical protein